MYNSDYTGAQVEALLDAVSGKTIYTAGTNITILNGVISSTGGGGGDEGYWDNYEEPEEEENESE